MKLKIELYCECKHHSMVYGRKTCSNCQRILLDLNTYELITPSQIFYEIKTKA